MVDAHDLELDIPLSWFKKREWKLAKAFVREKLGAQFDLNDHNSTEMPKKVNARYLARIFLAPLFVSAAWEYTENKYSQILAAVLGIFLGLIIQKYFHVPGWREKGQVYGKNQ